MVLKNFEGDALDWVGLVSNCTVGQFLGTSHSLLTHAEWTIMHLVSPPPPPPRILHDHCFQLLQGITVVPKEVEDNGYAKFWG